MKYTKTGWATVIAVTAAVTLLIAAVPPAVYAQATGLRVDIPFEFQVSNSVLPPGTYKLWLNSNRSAVSISDDKEKTVFSLITIVDRPSALNAADSLVVFNVYGDRHFLSEVRWAGYRQARSLPKSKIEIELAKAFSGPGATSAAVAAK